MVVAKSGHVKVEAKNGHVTRGQIIACDVETISGHARSRTYQVKNKSGHDRLRPYLGT